MKNTKAENLKDRTKRFAVETILFCAGLPKAQEFKIVARQLMRSASSVGANYRAACRARSLADFVAKMSIVEEEADESIYWMEILEGLGIGEDGVLKRLKDEADQLVAIVVASKKTARRRDN